MRLVEFDDLFRHGLRAQDRLGPTRLRWYIDPELELTARDLAEKESSCCSFFTFNLTTDPEALCVVVDVPAAHVEVLDALEARAAAGMTS